MRVQQAAFGLTRFIKLNRNQIFRQLAYGVRGVALQNKGLGWKPSRSVVGESEANGRSEYVEARGRLPFFFIFQFVSGRTILSPNFSILRFLLCFCCSSNESRNSISPFSSVPIYQVCFKPKPVDRFCNSWPN